MGIGKDCAIFMNINSNKYTDEEKVSAICSVVEMPTHNGVTKDAMLEVIRYALRRTAEDDKAREDGRLVELPCKVGDDVFTMRWSIKNKKYEVLAGKVKNVRYDAIDGSVMVSDGEYYREWGKDAFSSRQEAEAALGGGED